MASQFQLLSEEDLKKLSEIAGNQNTKKSTCNWIKNYKQWDHVRLINPNLEQIDAESLDKALSQFYGEVREQYGREYEPDSLQVMQNSLYRYLSEKGYNKGILKDQVFNEIRKILEGKARLLREQGLVKKKKPSKAIDSGKQDILWNYQKLGHTSSTSLVRTMWFLSTQHFGSPGCQEHTAMTVKTFVVLHDINGCEFTSFLEDPTKSRQGRIRPNQRATNLKMFAVGVERFPVRLFKVHLSK